MMVRAMTLEDYEKVHGLWMKIKGFSIRSMDDSKEGVARFLQEIRESALWRRKTEILWERFCADMTEEEAACIMYVWIRITGCGESVKAWLFLPWKRSKKKESTRFP